MKRLAVENRCRGSPLRGAAPQTFAVETSPKKKLRPVLHYEAMGLHSGRTIPNRIIEAITGPSPPPTQQALADALGLPLSAVRVPVWRLIQRGILTKDQLPWCRTAVETASANRKRIGTPLAEDLQRIIDEDGKDRVAAARLLHEMASGLTDTFAPPMPNDYAGLVAALTRCMSAAGREASTAAFDAAFPPEAHLETHTEVAGLPASGGSLD